MDDLYQFMSPQDGAPTINKAPATSTSDTDPKDQTSDASASAATPTSAGTKRSSTWGAWGSSASSWGSSFNKLIEKGKKDMHEFVDVTRKDLTELVQTVQAESSTTMESLSKTVEGLTTHLPPLPSTPLPTTAHSVDMLSRIQQHTVATDVDATTKEASDAKEKETTVKDEKKKKKEGEEEEEKEEGEEEEKDVVKTIPEGEAPASSTTTADEGDQPSSSSAAATRAQKTTSQSLGTAAASLLSNSAARANTLSQSLTSSTKELSSTASSLFKNTFQPAVEKQLGEADAFLKHTAESLKTNGLMAEQYVNKLGANVANFINSAVVVSPPADASVAPRSKKPV
ncbi:hypothetical protein DFQ27_009111 [Actinomortierella ambigua]|uniref:Phasin domain-containing protein n=1 Tax=Actinomortierella ambigua TaxID=1343610 RepID=A0A9P6TXK2_9FUNG|nr:hypothetical protein DFQ27_009111 [Actinomortierella ambigua]